MKCLSCGDVACFVIAIKSYKNSLHKFFLLYLLIFMCFPNKFQENSNAEAWITSPLNVRFHPLELWGQKWEAQEQERLAYRVMQCAVYFLQGIKANFRSQHWKVSFQKLSVTSLRESSSSFKDRIFVPHVSTISVRYIVLPVQATYKLVKVPNISWNGTMMAIWVLSNRSVSLYGAYKFTCSGK